jgi:WD40 repeat protein/sugar lactone lactonase YvrE
MPDRIVLAALIGIFVSTSPVAATEDVVLEQVVSRHDPHFDVAQARLCVGRDGDIYLASGGKTAGYVLRVTADGQTRTGRHVGYSTQAVAVNKAGVIATAEGHFAHRIAFWGRESASLGHVADYLVGDQVQWNAPADVCAGQSGDFYGVDQHRLRILRVSAPDKQAEAYSLELTGEQSRGGLVGLRVDEERKRFVTAWPSGTIWATSFAGKPLWSLRLKPAGEQRGGFDLDAAGNLYVCSGGTEVKVFDVEGRAVGDVKLKSPGTFKPLPLQDLRILGKHIVIKRLDPKVLFEVYDRESGEWVRRVNADVEVLTARYPSPVWSAGKSVPFVIQFDAGSRPTRPRFQVWLRPLGVPEFTLMSLVDGAITVPRDCRGLYQLRVTPDIAGRAADYVVNGFIEVRAPDVVGSVAISTPWNRFYYGQGEEIPVAIEFRTQAGGAVPSTITIALKKAGISLREWKVGLTDGKGKFTVSREETEQFPTGRASFDCSIAGFTVAPQYLELGPGIRSRPAFHIVQHGDYTSGFPADLRASDTPEAIADHLQRTRKLGINLFVDRLGHPATGLGLLNEVTRDNALLERLRSDPLASAPAKAEFEGPVRRALGAYGAYGIEEQGILLYMDAGLPLGRLFDTRKPEQMVKDLQTASKQLLPYPAFRGWSWAANWWLDQHGASSATDAAEKAAYEAALQKAKETGSWSPILETVSNRTFGYAFAAEQRFRAALQEVAPGKLSVMTGPYRAIQTHPPTIFQTADEVDLHYQAEQIQPPQVTPHNVDFYRRPGKAAWGHPELWNDDGTGGMIFPSLFQMVMRGANGVGQSGKIEPWGGYHPGQSDPRCAASGTTSSYRAIYELLQLYGPWLASLENADRVAIVVSTRMARLENWDGKIGSAYFDSLFEAYNACLYAHRPASFVFVEDLKPDTLKQYQAILVVSQRVELDPPLAAAIKRAQDAGITVFHDETCRPEIVKDLVPLGLPFDRVKQDPDAWQDDAAYFRFPHYFKTHAKQLREILGPVVPAVAVCANPEVMLTEKHSGEGRFIWAVNNTMLDLEPGLAWRLSLLMTHRVPVVETLKLDVPEGWVVHDVFAREIVKHNSGVVTCDLRTMPARLYAVLPPGKTLPFLPGNVSRLFGPHIRDIAISTDGKTALVNTFNWDHNLYTLNLEKGETQCRGKVGHGFAFGPQAAGDGFTVQGFDVRTGEGYHLYKLDSEGKPIRRFALFGLPKRATNWAAASQLQDVGINNFAAAADGSWVASSGDLGLVVWDKEGKELWSEEWWKSERKRVHLLVLNNNTLVTLDGNIATARESATGRRIWSVTPVESGNLLGGTVSADLRTLVLQADTLGGRLLVIRDGELVNTLLTASDEVAVSRNGDWIAATAGRQLKVFDPRGGLLWTFTGDDILRHPRISPDGNRIAVGSELGTLTILSRSGLHEAEKDFGALPVSAWLPGGNLLIGTWSGAVYRTTAKLESLSPAGRDAKYTSDCRLTPTETAAQTKLLAREDVPTIRKSGWGNATAIPLPLTPNLLAESKALILAVSDPRASGDPRPWQNKIDLLTDGKPGAPPKPWLEWTDIGLIDSGWRSKFAIEIDTFRTQLQVTGVTFVEDPTHPDSWLRDLRLQWWDAAREQWREGPYLLSDASTHSHRFDQPLVAARFRLVSTGGGTWPAGNIRLGELVFHGEVLGCSHPDAVAKKPVAVLFDELESDLTALKQPGRPFHFRYGGALSGGKCLELASAGETGPLYRPPFGHAIPNWNFEVAEHPQPGQYRYLQFAWKASSDKTTGMGLLLGRAWPGGGVAVVVGDARWKEGEIVRQQQPGKPPLEWTTVRVDLWAATKGKPLRIQALNLRSEGGGALFDQIVLSATEVDLDRVKPLK